MRGTLKLLPQIVEDCNTVGLPKLFNLSIRDSRNDVFEKCLPINLITKFVHNHINCSRIVRLEYLGLHKFKKSQRHSKNYLYTFDKEQIPHDQLCFEGKMIHK